MKNLIKHAVGIYEFKTDTNMSFMIDRNKKGSYDVTMLEDDEAVDDIGEFGDVITAVNYLTSE